MEKFNNRIEENNGQENEKIKESIEKIENALLPVDQKIDLMLLMLDRKSATFLGDLDGVESEEHKQKLIKEFTEEFNTLIVLLKDIDLPYEIIREVENRDDTIGFSIVVTKEVENLTKIERAVRENDDRTMGLLFGYPKTAVETYNTQDAIDLETEFPDEFAILRKEGMVPFLGFAPSKSHWKEELEWARDNKKSIEQHSPNTLNLAIKESEEYMDAFARERSLHSEKE